LSRALASHSPTDHLLVFKAPYAAGKKSFYEEPRKKMLAFIVP
jgi:hypothetical protein